MRRVEGVRLALFRLVVFNGNSCTGHVHAMLNSSNPGDCVLCVPSHLSHMESDRNPVPLKGQWSHQDLPGMSGFMLIGGRVFLSHFPLVILKGICITTGHIFSLFPGDLQQFEESEAKSKPLSANTHVSVFLCVCASWRSSLWVCLCVWVLACRQGALLFVFVLAGLLASFQGCKSQTALAEVGPATLFRLSNLDKGRICVMHPLPRCLVCIYVACSLGKTSHMRSTLRFDS